MRGVFDHDSAGWADRHHDFRYLALEIPGEPLLEEALAVYEPAGGRKLSRGRIWLYNAASAICFPALRQGRPPDDRSYGRTLEEDLGWVRSALDRAATFQ